eukprot:11208593-Lingulodinium_polyedra.AAC.1
MRARRREQDLFYRASLALREESLRAERASAASQVANASAQTPARASPRRPGRPAWLEATRASAPRA